jgi:hypothetical protein
VAAVNGPSQELTLLEYVEALLPGHRARLELADLLEFYMGKARNPGDDHKNAIQRLRRKRTVGADESPAVEEGNIMCVDDNK